MTASGAAAGGASVGSHGWPDDPSPWVVVDRDDRVEVGGLRVSWTFWLIMGVILIPFVILIPIVDVIIFSVVIIVIAAVLILALIIIVIVVAAIA